jgi:hypothetical protein
MAFDFDFRPERSDFVGLFGLQPGAGREALQAGARAAGRSILGVEDQPIIVRDTGNGSERDNDGPSAVAIAAFIALGLGLAMAVRR